MYMMFPLCVLGTIVVSSMLVKAFFVGLPSSSTFLLFFFFSYFIFFFFLSFPLLLLLSEYMQTIVCKGASKGATMGNLFLRLQELYTTRLYMYIFFFVTSLSLSLSLSLSFSHSFFFFSSSSSSSSFFLFLLPSFIDFYWRLGVLLCCVLHCWWMRKNKNPTLFIGIYACNIMC